MKNAIIFQLEIRGGMFGKLLIHNGIIRSSSKHIQLNNGNLTKYKKFVVLIFRFIYYHHDYDDKRNKLFRLLKIYNEILRQKSVDRVSDFQSNIICRDETA